MAEVTQLFPAGARWNNPDGTLTPLALRSLSALTSLLGGSRGNLPPSLLLSLNDGSAGTPALSFEQEPDLGIFRAGEGELGIASGGAEVARFGPEGLLLEGLRHNAFLYNGPTGRIATTGPALDGQILIGNTNEAPELGSIEGVPNQVQVTGGPGAIIIGLLQDLGPGSDVTFHSLTLSGLTENSFLYSGVDGLLTTTAAPTDGQLLIGSTGVAPVAAALTGTANQVTVTNAAGTITLSLPQDIATTSSPTFANLTDSGLTAHGILFATTAKLIASTGAPTNGQLLIGATAADPALAALTGTANQVVVTNGTNSITLSLPQSINSSANVTFNSLTLGGLTANSFLLSGTAGLLTTTAAPTNGQLLIGSTGVAPAKAALTGTANQVTVTNGAGTITLSGPQDLGTSSSPTFAGITVTTFTIAAGTASAFVYNDASGHLATTTNPTNGQLLIGSTGTIPAKAALTGTANQVVVSNGAGTITLSLPQDIGTGSAPTFANLTDSGLTVHGMLFATTAKVITSTGAPTNGQLLIGAGSADPALATLTGTANQVVVTNGASTITLSLPQDIATGSSPTFANVTDSGLTAQGMLYANASKVITSTGAPTNGQLLIGATSAAPALAALTGTANQVIVTNAANSITLSLPQSIATSSTPSFAGETLTGNLTFSGNGLLITGDMSSGAGSINNRVFFQSSTANGQTIISVRPNGTSQIAGLQCYSSSSDPNNSSRFNINVQGVAAVVSINSDASGTGTVLPMVFYINSVEAARLTTGLDLGIGTASPAGRLHTLKDAAANNSFFENYENTGATSGSVHILRRSRGSLASPTAVLSDDRLGGFAFGGQRSTTPGDFVNSVLVIGQAAENFAAGAAGSRIVFEAVPIGSVTRAEIGRWNPTGNLLIGSATESAGAEKLQVTGSLSISSAVMIRTYTAFTNGAAASLGTLTNAPVAGNPTKWIPINDNGTTRYIPAW